MADAATSAQASKVEQDMLKSLVQKQIDLGCDKAKQAEKTLKEAEAELPPPKELEKQARKEDSETAACSDTEVEIEEAQKAETKEKAKEDCLDAQLKKDKEALGNENDDPCAEPAPSCMCCDELYAHHEEHAKQKGKEDAVKKADKKLEATQNAKKQQEAAAEIAAANPELVTPPSPMPQPTLACPPEKPSEKPTEVKPDSKESTTTTAKPS
ncbi:MAG: hypothetical protein KVP17_003080 [Porospora cf. gigantea B]|uniref:uncharacterized protein n=1 Tax=Porospora cf. gigantea B TaxID=2853592 RepID=UPI003571F7FF|nr:MAG: hypothetical protein KVP17_003080 [Porospora cf. gigantea B]